MRTRQNLSQSALSGRNATPRHFRSLAVLALFTTLVTACSSAPKVSRLDVDSPVDLSGRWNDTDSRLVSEEMVRDALDHPWSDDFNTRTGREPRVIVAMVRNESHEHLNTETFTRDLERQLINSGRIRFVASSGQRDVLRRERTDQAKYATMETMKGMGNELGADFMLQGQINTILDSAGGKQVRFYQVELEMISIESNEKVWIGQKKLKKLIERSRYGL